MFCQVSIVFKEIHMDDFTIGGMREKKKKKTG